jgi:V/A-type H+-transporting ATPase subunit B
LLAIDVNIEIEKMLDTSWKLFGKYFKPAEIAIKESLMNKYFKPAEKEVEEKVEQ